MIITDFDLEDEDDDESELKYLEVDTEDLETSNKSSSSADTKGLIKSISKSKVVLDNEDDDEYDFADEDDIDSLEFDGKDYDVDDDEFEKFIDNIDSALDDDEVYIELTLDSHDKITEAVAYTCTTAEDDIDYDSIDTSDDTIHIDDDDYEYSSSTIVDIVDGDDKITKMSDLEDALDEDKGKTITVTAVVNDDDEILSITGYVSEISGVDLDDFKYRSSYEPDECSVEIDGTEYTFDSGWDIEDIKKLYDEYDDGDTEVDMKLNDEGVIEDGDLSLS